MPFDVLESLRNLSKPPTIEHAQRLADKYQPIPKSKVVPRIRRVVGEKSPIRTVKPPVGKDISLDFILTPEQREIMAAKRSKRLGHIF